MITNDPLAVAVETAERGNFIFGEVQVSAQFVVLQKGVGKSTFIDGTHSPQDRRTEVTFIVNPIEQSGLTQLITRAMLAESAEWSRIVWPSLRDDCKVAQVREIDNKFVKVELVKTGRKWNDRKTGEEREGTTFKFHAVYQTLEACKSAYLAEGYSDRSSNITYVNDAVADAMAVDMTQNAHNPERESCKAFLPMLVKSAAGNRQQLATVLASMSPLNKYFHVDSPEVVALLNAA